LLAQPFDTATATLSGTTELVASGVGSWGPATAGLWSVSHHGDVVYRGGGSGLPQLTWRDMKGRVLENVGQPRPFADVALSPNGTRVAYRLTDARGNLDIFVQRPSEGQGHTTHVRFGRRFRACVVVRRNQGDIRRATRQRPARFVREER
jgi:hypothetical protein